MKRVVLVTGASGGIGLEACLRFIEKGYEVYGAARHLEKMDELVKRGGHALYLDLTDEKSVDECVNKVIKEQGRVDVLVNNAGYAAGGALEEVPLEEARRQFEVNVFALVLMIKKVLPVMRSQKSGRIINISSVAGRFSSPFLGWYHAAKYSVEALSDALRLETADFGIKVVLIEPGLIRTSWGGIAADSIRQVSGNGVYSDRAEKIASFYDVNYRGKGKISAPSAVAACIVKASCKKHPSLRYCPGRGAKILVVITRFLPGRLYDFFCRKFFGI